MAPSRLMSMTWARSVEKQPEAGITGFCSVTAPICTRISTMQSPLPSDRFLHVEHRPFDADTAQDLLAVHVEGADTDVAGAEPARHHLLHRHLPGDIVRLA